MPERFHELILFADKNFEGAHKHVFRSQPYLGDAFNDLTSSFIVLSGAWKFYKDKDFATAQGSVFSPRLRGYDWVVDYDVTNDALSSVALVDDDTRAVPHLIAFSRTSFGGGHRHLVRDLTSNALRGTHSLVVFWGQWRLTDADGRTADVLPGSYPDLNPLGVNASRLQSIALLDGSIAPETSVPHLIAFADSEFGGDHRHIVADQPRLGGGWDSTLSSLIVEHGTWRLYLHNDYGGPSRGPISAGASTASSRTSTSRTTPFTRSVRSLSRPPRSSSRTRISATDRTS